jgi:prevent-host-death family protein
MAEVTIRELRNRGGHVIERVLRGERITITRNGAPVAELRPLTRPRVSSAVLLEHWSHLPPIDAVAFRRDIDDVLDSRL